MTVQPFTESELDRVVTMTLDGCTSQEIGAVLGRSPRSIRGQIGALRRDRRLPKAWDVDDARAAAPPLSIVSPPLHLANDNALVSLCLRAGGFPRAVVLNGSTYWLNHEDRQWTAAA
jgi:hypothetical protein